LNSFESIYFSAELCGKYQFSQLLLTYCFRLRCKVATATRPSIQQLLTRSLLTEAKMIYSLQVLLTFILVVISTSDAFRMSRTAQSSGSLQMALSDYKKELAETAALIAGPGIFVLNKK
jgi:hypothetical protein